MFSISDSVSRREREEKVRATKEKLEKEKERKMQELLDAQKMGEFVAGLGIGGRDSLRGGRGCDCHIMLSLVLIWLLW